MARKDSQTTRPPVEHYRKQIGKQDIKKSKADLKEIKKKAQAKQFAATSYKEVFLMVGALAVVVFSLYALLYYFLANP